MYSEQDRAQESIMDIDSFSKSRPRRSANDSRQQPYRRTLLPYAPPTHSTSERWSHDLFGAMIPGGNLAFRLNKNDTAAAKIAARNGGRGGGRDNDLLDPGLDLFGKKEETEKNAQIPSRPRDARPSQPQRENKTPAEKGIGIKGASMVNKKMVEVGNLAPGTTAEDVKMTFNTFGAIVSSSISSQTNQSVTVLIEFAKPTFAEAAISAFHGQIADGRTISVQFSSPQLSISVPTAPSSQQPRSRPTPSGPAASNKNAGSSLSNRLAPVAPRAPAPGGLFGRLGLVSGQSESGAGKKSLEKLVEGGDLMDGIGGSSKMYSDTMDTSSNPRPRQAGRGRGGKRGGSQRSRRGVGNMDID
ncbi:RNA-binding protein (RRM superfamily) [Phaffia rhodozyma]|uniref:RNA-binding protein (RRM superfamily) n=1 Tax=Phaffia rhodozyma TaxID=264483 RepID=A0A0F7SJ55_PHARH|nr:RNA-binding protein (RRM superfamily) [Phaffia rhodozyma]